jgi:hypothetical protein
MGIPPTQRISQVGRRLLSKDELTISRFVDSAYSIRLLMSIVVNLNSSGWIAQDPVCKLTQPVIKFPGFC